VQHAFFTAGPSPSTPRVNAPGAIAWLKPTSHCMAVFGQACPGCPSCIAANCLQRASVGRAAQLEAHFFLRLVVPLREHLPPPLLLVQRGCLARSAGARCDFSPVGVEWWYHGMLPQSGHRGLSIAFWCPIVVFGWDLACWGPKLGSKAPCRFEISGFTSFSFNRTNGNEC
jgi:hypothetical protein